jgi:hypothetical protein
VLYFCVQDTILVVPFCIEEDRHDVPREDCWYARPQLFFTCVLGPKDGRLPKIRTYKACPDDIVYTLVFFSTFEELKLPIKGPMEDAGVINLYEPSPTPCLYVADVQNMMDRVPLNILCHCFWLLTRLQQSLTYSASARIQASCMAVLTRLQRTDCGAAMSMRSTRGCGSLGGASPAWEA